jgi:hypothetical protein
MGLGSAALQATTYFAPATTGTAILAGNGSGGFSPVTVGTGLSYVGGTLSALDAGGTVTSVTAQGSADISVTGGPITTSGTLYFALSDTTVAAGTYGSATQVGQFNVDAKGRLTTAASVTIAIAASAVSGLATVATSGAYADLTGKPTLGTISSQDSSNVSITGGSINGTAVGASTASTGKFTTLDATGNVGFDGGTFTFNEAGADKDFRFEGDTQTHLLFGDASVDRIGIALTAPAARLDISGNYAQNIVAVAALDIDCSAGNFFTKTIAANSTFTFSNVPATRAFAFTLELTHTSGAVTWPAAVKWPANTAPTLTTGKTHIFIFVTDDSGTTWRGAALVDYVN